VTGGNLADDRRACGRSGTPNPAAAIAPGQTISPFRSYVLASSGFLRPGVFEFMTIAISSFRGATLDDARNAHTTRVRISVGDGGCARGAMGGRKARPPFTSRRSPSRGLGGGVLAPFHGNSVFRTCAERCLSDLSGSSRSRDVFAGRCKT